MDRQDIAARVEALSRVTALPVLALDESGKEIVRGGEPCEYCRIFQKYLANGESCEGLHMLAGRRALDLGEAYLFSCHAGLCHIALPLLRMNAFEGAVLVGPFVLGELDSTLVQDVARRYPLPTDALLDMYEAAGAIRTLSTGEAGALCKLVYFLFEAASGTEAMEGRRRRIEQQQKIGESIQMYKGFAAAAPAYPYEKERALILYVKSGDVKQANAVLNELLGFTLFSTGGEIETIKSWTAELCALLSRAAIEGGIGTDAALDMNRSFMRTLWQARTIEELCYFMQEAVERFCISAFPASSAGERAARFIKLHYAENITLSDVAKEAHLSESYFSTVFKKTFGASFREYLAAVRVEEAKRLLAQGTLSVTEIALAVGFESQSYFSKVFHETTGATPKQYRKELHAGHAE